MEEVKQLGKSRSRARSPEQKAEIRRHLIDAGRKLFANEEPASVSVRRIAKEAGYTPATIYNYFADQLDLYATIREQDMEEAVLEIEALTTGIADPAERLTRIFDAAIRHWMAFPEHFEIIYAQRVDDIGKIGGKPLGAAPVATRFYVFYRDAVDGYLRFVGNDVVNVDEATDTIVTATMGILLFVRHTSTWQWSAVPEMSANVVKALMESWRPSA